MEILIKNARLIDPELDEILDIYIKDGLIDEIGENLVKDCKVVNGEGLLAMPSFIDLHAHFREPGWEYKENIETGSKAALRGGYTGVNAMANTNPIASKMETIDYVLNRSKELDLIDLHQTASLTYEFDGKTLDHIDRLDREKVKFLSDDGMGVVSNKVVYDAMIKAKERDFTIMTHAEDMELTPIDYRISENIITFRDIYLSEVTEAKLHMSHVSTKEAIESIRQAKKKGVKVTCEVTPHHIALWNLDYRVNPPIREREDAISIIEGIKDGTVDAIATDHAPHTEDDKKKGAPGMSGIETSFSICYTKLVKDGHINLQKLVSIMSTNPAKIMGVNKGKLKPGYQGDITLVDINKNIIINREKFLSKGKNTPFHGKEFTGDIVATIYKGRLKYLNKEYNIE